MSFLSYAYNRVKPRRGTSIFWTVTHDGQLPQPGTVVAKKISKDVYNVAHVHEMIGRDARVVVCSATMYGFVAGNQFSSCPDMPAIILFNADGIQGLTQSAHSGGLEAALYEAAGLWRGAKPKKAASSHAEWNHARWVVHQMHQQYPAMTRLSRERDGGECRLETTHPINE
ncbi:hypothetical protein PENSPDRAFT_694165 [Peniophora sp. CONT]|nr:hypothetical protein PENSPDRAFT_694165 [Peniophora sp. CONT]